MEDCVNLQFANSRHEGERKKRTEGRKYRNSFLSSMENLGKLRTSSGN